MNWTLPKKWKIVNSEVIQNDNERRDTPDAKIFVILTIDFFSKKHWWSKEIVSTKQIAIETKKYRGTISAIDDFYWFPEMKPFKAHYYTVEDYSYSVFFGSYVSSFRTAELLEKALISEGNSALIKTSKDWQKVIANYQSKLVEDDKPVYKETKSAYR